MHAAYRRTSASHRLLAPLPGTASSGTADVMASPAPERFAYGDGRRFNWPVIAALAVAHVVLLAALIKLDVIPIGRPAPRPIVVELIEVPKETPPPAAADPTPPDPVKPPVTMPDPIVQPPAPSPSPMVAVIQPPKAPPVPAVAAGTGDGPPAPVTPPDFSADYLNNPSPRYPVESRRLREQGTVTIKVLVSPEGTVQDLKMAESSGHSRLDKAALAAVRGWRFAPARQMGKAVAAWVIVPIPFVLKG